METLLRCLRPHHFQSPYRLPPEFAGAYATIFSEHSVKMAFIGKVELKRNFIDAHGTMQQARFYQLEAVMGNILLQAFAGMLFKVFAQVVDGKAKGSGHLLSL